MPKMSVKTFFSVASVVVLALSFGQTVAGQDGNGKLAGTWNVTLKFPTCSATCLANSLKSSLRATKSVSQLISTSAPIRPPAWM